MRAIITATILAAALSGSTAFAQSGYVHHRFCLKTGSGQDCGYQTMAQCEAAKRGNADFCVQNGAPINHGMRQ